MTVYETHKLDEAELLRYIAAFRKREGYAPSIREMAAEFDVNRNAIQYRLGRMADEGLLRRAPGVSRGISVSKAGMKMMTERV